VTATRAREQPADPSTATGRVAGRPDIELVDVVPQGRDGSRRVLVAMAAAVVFVVFAILLVHVRLTQLAFELKTAQETLQQRRDLHNKLGVTVADLEAPGRIRRESRRIGMVEPTIAHYLYSDQVPTADVVAPPVRDAPEEVMTSGDQNSGSEAQDPVGPPADADSTAPGDVAPQADPTGE
jgi:hypothetical protein